MAGDATLVQRLAEQLPEAATTDGLAELVEGLLAYQVPLSGMDRVRLSVLAEEQGVRERITPGLLRCLGDGVPAVVRLLDEEEVLPGSGGLVLVPWIGCNRCGQALLRAHTWEDWDDVSDRAEKYLVGAAEFATAGEAFAELVGHCGSEGRGELREGGRGVAVA
ncbi:hypothetical protein [Kitasatospora sp. MMS16-BH015]|uniref:hypothetical protein n=1 Tax=Kitasatospora sp. MMS16-BH015 TaxID=2018025 RepID=UPI000CF1F780|nr:hypothetical protein [Kitasatospora sp. MMS16-BH015]